MRAIDTTTQALLDDGVWIQRGMVTFDLPDGIYGFWDGAGTYTWNGIDFVGGASLIEVEAVEETGGTASTPLTMRLRDQPDAGLTADILAQIEDQDYHFRPVTLYLAFFDADGLALASVETMYRGRIDRIRHVETADGDAYIEGEIVSRAEDYSKVGVRIRSDRDQMEIYAGDKFFQWVGDVRVLPPYWGGEAPKPIRAGPHRRIRNRRNRGE